MRLPCSALLFSTCILLVGSSSVPLSETGGACNSSAPSTCTAPNSVCIQNICECRRSFRLVNGTCSRASILSNVLSLGSYQREAGSGIFPSESSSRRYASRAKPASGLPPDAICSRDSECAGYPLAYCDGVCQCTYNALNAGSTCIATAPQQSTACPPGQTYIPEAGACMTGQYPGEPCQYSLQCSAIEPGAFCLRLRCECMYGMVRSGNGCTFVSDECHERGFVFIPELGECRQVLPPGSVGCTYSLQCSQAFSGAACMQQTCTCPSSLPEAVDGSCGRRCELGQTYSAAAGQCLPTVQAGDPCVYTAQCHASQSGMVCERNVCRCPTGMVSSGSKCTQSCPTGYMVNSKGVCTPGCQSNQIEVNGECLSQSVPGQDCRVNAQCTGGSSCLNYQCTCPRGMFPRGGACEFVSAAPLSSCRDGERCTRDAICVDGACVCPAGRQIVNGQCLTSITVPPMSPCGSFVSCGGGSSCIEGICQCPQNLQSVNGSCQYRSSVAPGSPCPTGLERCLSQATCVNGVCQCPFGMVAQGNDCVALRAVPAGSTCNRTSRCRGLAVCVDGICHSPADLPLSNGQCRAGTVNINGVCVEQNTAAPGSSCASGQTCSGGSNCMNSICVCPAGQVNIEEQCRLVTNILGSCDVNMKCVGGAVCDVTRRLCVCPARSVVVRGSCVDITNVARMSRKLRTDSSPECIADSDCPRLKSCVKGRCMIGIYGNSPPQGELQKSSSRGLAEFFQGRQSPTSVKKEQQFKKHRHVNIGGGCVRLGAVCLGGSVCVAGICVCPLGTTPHLNRCIEHRTAKPGESCSRYEECTGDTHCNPLTLTCDCNRETQMVVGSRCVERLRSHPGLPCSNGEICVGTSVCLHGTCSCPAGFVIVNRECVVIRRARPSEECGNGEECEGGSVCDQVRKRCICREGQRLVNDRCEDYVVLPGGSCSSIHARCSGGSHCFEGRCVCPQATYISGGLCIPRRAVGPGNYCGNNDVCMGGSECRENVCSCSTNTVLKGNECVISRKVSYGERCTDVDECQGNSTCTGHVCECPPGMVNRDGICQRRLTVNPGYLCGVDDLCVRHSICIRGVCQCRPGEQIVHSQCVRSDRDAVVIGGECSRGEQCLGGSTCKEGVCVCPVGTVVSSHQCKKVLKVLPGSPCASGEQCDGGSVCNSISKTCRCLPGFQQHHTQCIRMAEARPRSSAADTSSDAEKATPPAMSPQDRTVVSSPPLNQKILETSTASRVKMPVPPSSSNLVKSPVPDAATSHLRLTRPDARPPTTAKPLPWFKTRRCSTSNQCPSGSSCVSGECRCSQGLALNRLGLCVPVTYVHPGMACSDGEVCRGDAECRSGVCVCPTGRRLQDNQCLSVTREKRKVPRAPVNEKDAQFINLMKNAEQSLSKLSAPLYASLGDSCSFQMPCIAIGSQCINGVCECSSGSVQSGNSCVALQNHNRGAIGPGQRCSPGVFCSGGASCVAGACRCPNGFLPRQNICMRALDPSVSTCGSSGECGFGASCINGRCACQQGATAVGGLCVPPFLGGGTTGTFGTPCADNTVFCVGGSLCVGGVCACPGGQQNINNVCAPTIPSNLTLVPPGLSCVEGENFCTGNSVCANGYCVCPGGEVIQNQMCIPVDTEASPGEMCEAGVTKCTGHSQCINGVCRCPPGQVLLAGEKRCALVQNACPISSCCAGKCPCPNNANPTGPLCFPTILPMPIVPSPYSGAPGQQCDFRKGSRLCNGRALCIKNQCVCPTNLILNGNRCVEFVGNSLPGQSCATPGVICRGGSSCSGGICKCDFDFVVRNYQCTPTSADGVVPVPTPFPMIFTFVPGPLAPVTAPSTFIFSLRPGAACDPNCGTCSQRCGGGSICIGGVCTCPVGTYDFLGVCTPLTSQSDQRSTTAALFARPGERCDIGIRCTGGSTCVLGTCTCNDGYQPSLDRASCVLTSLPLSQRAYPVNVCKDDEQCPGKSTCSLGKCVCPGTQTLEDGICVQKLDTPYPGSPCFQRCANGASCVSDFCVCTSGQSTNASGHCVSASSSNRTPMLPGAPCDSNPSGCEGNSQCLNGFCVCSKGSVNKGAGVCWEAQRASVSCKSYKDCISPRVCGPNLTCECPFTMREDSNGVCRYRKKSVAPGSSCSRGEECDVGSSCVDGVCKCERGPTVIGKRCTNPTRMHRDLHAQPQFEQNETLRRCPEDGSCALPSCFCSQTGTVPPGGLSTANVPQLVVLSFDGPVTDRAMKLYKLLFNGKHRNPNGCAIKGTFFISHQWNNYDQTQWLYGQGHEIAVNSITHEALRNETLARWIQEMVGMKDALAAFSNVERSSIVGIRAPQLSIGGDAQFQMMKDNGFLYDNSMPVSEGPLWPQTLDYAPSWSCSDQTCPKRRFPGVWSFPLQLLQANDGVWHNTARAALKPSDSRSSVKQFLRRNFYRNYNTNRAPFVLTADTDFLSYLPDNGVVLAVDDWLSEILKNKDVFVVTAKQAISWMEWPVSVNKAVNFKPWQCTRHGYDHLQPCETPSICSYTPSVVSQAHSFRLCGTCPRSYPWLGDPLGKRS